MGTYVSCNCKHCRHAPSNIKAEHKRDGHRALRRASKKAIREGKDAPASVSTGYKD